MDVRYYAVQDWMRGMMQKDDVRADWRMLQKRAPQLLNNVLQLPYKASNGKTYQMDYADAQTLYGITQRISANTGLRNDILAFLAKAGVLADDIRRNPSAALEAGVSGLQSAGKDEQWIATRAQSVIARNHFTAALRDAIPEITSRDFARATNDLYLGLWGRVASELKNEMGLKPTASLRDHQPTEALAYLILAESVIKDHLGKRRTLTIEEAQDIVQEVAHFIGQQAEATSRLLGRDIATNKPLLSDGKEDRS
jgi:hypothetical protein